MGDLGFIVSLSWITLGGACPWYGIWGGRQDTGFEIMNLDGNLINAFARLARAIEGEVHTDALRRYMLSTDASIFKKMPLAVVYPRTTD